MLGMFIVGLALGIQWVHLAVRQRDNPRTGLRVKEIQVALLGISFASALVMWVGAMFTRTVADDTVTFLAVACAIVGAAFRISAIEEIGRGFSWGTEAPAELITSGAYRYLKHPLIVGYILEVIALAAVGVGPWWLKITVIFTALFAAALQIRKEESVLRERFGRQWAVYASQKLL